MNIYYDAAVPGSWARLLSLAVAHKRLGPCDLDINTSNGLCTSTKKRVDEHLGPYVRANSSPYSDTVQ